MVWMMAVWTYLDPLYSLWKGGSLVIGRCCSAAKVRLVYRRAAQSVCQAFRVDDLIVSHAHIMVEWKRGGRVIANLVRASAHLLP